MTVTSDEKSWEVVSLHKRGRSQRWIALHQGLSRDTVARIIRSWEATGRVQPKKGTGRPRMLKHAAGRAAAEMLADHAPTSARQVAQELHARGLADSVPSKQTVLRAAAGAAVKEGQPIAFGTCRPSYQLSTAQKAKRLAFAKRNLKRNWQHVMFTDRKRFLFWHPGVSFSKRRFYRKGRRHTVPTASHPKAVNVYMGITWWGTTPVARVAGTQGHKFFPKGTDKPAAKNITKAEYMTVLKQTILPAGCRLYGRQGLNSWVLQQDGDPAHNDASSVCAAYNKQHNKSITVLPHWPPHSPDLNPIENLWALVQRQVEAQGCLTFAEFEEAVETKLQAVSKEQCRGYIHNMHSRLLECIEREGDWTDY